MISIIIPVYRSDKTIMRCLQSIERSSVSTRTPAEAVIVFDGPDTKTAAIVDEFITRTSIRISTHDQPHCGIAAARNTGIEKARHSVLTFLDADDEITPERLEFAMKITPQCIAIGHQKLADPTKGIPGLHPAQQGKDSVPYLTSLITTRDTLQELGALDELLTLGDDWDLLLRARRSEINIQFNPGVWTIRHINDQNASHQTKALASDYLAAIRKHIRNRKPPSEGQDSEPHYS